MLFIIIVFFIIVPWLLFNWLGISGVLGFVIFVLLFEMVSEVRKKGKLRRTLEDKLVRIEEDLKDEKIENKERLEGSLSALDWVSREIGMSSKRGASLEKEWKKTLAKMEEEKVKKKRLITELYKEGKDEKEILAKLLEKGFDDYFYHGLDYEIRMEIARLRHEIDPKNWTAH